jgi:kynureninase
MSSKRLFVTLEESIFNDISDIAKTNNQSLSTIAKNLIASALEIHEDINFSRLADQSVALTKEWISHEEVMKNV